MSPTLQGTADAGDWVLVENISYWFRKPHRWEVVRFTSAEGMQVMKRVVGLPGERLSLSEGRPVINGQRQNVPPSLQSLYYFAYGPKLRNGAVAECAGGYFIFGDDSKDSWDSRYEGPLAPERLQGRAWLRVWPMNRFGFVNP
jgi:signal peptidase I